MHHTPILSTIAMTAFVFSSAVAAPSPDQPAPPDADQAPFILGSLDLDNDGKISKSEARDGMKQNFAFLDANGDGGIDLTELERMLSMVAAQRGSGSSTPVFLANGSIRDAFFGRSQDRFALKLRTEAFVSLWLCHLNTSWCFRTSV